ncbi:MULTISPECIES: rSAM-modified peptide [Flavobacterium]|jgi:hypothetical protein|uniref:RSAM-modified peptide n=1 Tax=Flavobacterium cupriresistens TaxID=2893885 RepID=A0ABU4REJ7_9FLAO|nr:MULTISPECIES: rSAM-modified peptide [unclassified Flavobacterium]MDX6191015.1 rSAM-modified peptide [Flavobacterium sp. Fl-318]UFH43813.1 rSAM-modified peptide [Flavobacterium sp. F-323]
MKIRTFNLEDFGTEKLPKNQLKTVRGGDEWVDGKDPIRGTGHTGSTGGNG